MYNIRKIKKNKYYLDLMCEQVAHFSEKTFFSTMLSSHLDEEGIKDLTFELKRFLPVLEFEGDNLTYFAKGFCFTYTTNCNDIIVVIKEVYQEVDNSIALLKQLCVTFQQINTKQRCKHVPAGNPRPHVFTHNWLFDPSYSMDAFNNQGYPQCVYELFDVMQQCIRYISDSLDKCKSVQENVQSVSQDKEHSMQLLEEYYDVCQSRNFYFSEADLEASGDFIKSWTETTDKGSFAATYYHNCSEQDGYALSCHIRKEKERLHGCTPEEVELFGNVPNHIEKVRYFISNVENEFDLMDCKKIPGHVVYAIMSWENKHAFVASYLEKFLAYFRSVYKGDKNVVKLRALQKVHSDSDKTKVSDSLAILERYKNTFLSVKQ